MWRWIWLLAFLCAIFVVAAQQSGHATEVEKGFAWLRTQVQANGTVTGETSSQALPVQVRTETLHTLALLDSRPAELANLIDSQPQKHTELQARKALALRLANRDAQQVIADLGLQQNADGGFGSRREYGSNALDTAYALIALASVSDADQTRVANALTYLRTSRLSPSGWPVGDHPSVHVTSAVLLAGQAWSSRYQVGDITTAARDWLLGQRNAGSTYGNVVDDANALLALTTQTSDNAVLGPLTDALRASQRDDGSWGEDPYITAIALRALFRSTVGLPPSTTGAITGSIVDSATRAPIAGVNLTVRAMPELRVATAVDGSFMLLGLPQGSHTVDIQTLGYVSTSFSATVTIGNTTSTGQIPLQKTTLTAEVSGVVRNNGGIALANVVVSSGTVSSFTDATGRYSLTGLNAGAATVTFALNGYRTLDVPVMLEPGKRYQLSPTLYTTSQTPPTTATIRGTVTQQANGQAVAGASVRIGTSIVTTNASGVFELTGLSAGGYALQVEASGFLAMQGSVTLAAGLNDVGSIALSRAPETSTLVGVVVDERTRAPVASAVLVVQGQVATAVSGPDGRYILQGVQGTEFSVIASGQGYVSRTLAISLPTIGQSTLDIELLPIGNNDIVFEAVSTNRPIYRPSGEVELEVEVRNGGTVAADLVIDAEVIDADGNIVFVFKANALGLGQNPPNQPLRFDPGSLREIEMDWVLERARAGVYTIVAHARDTAGRVRAEGTTRFTVDAMPILGGAVIADPPLSQVDSETPIRITAELANLGNRPIPAGTAELTVTLDATDPALVGQPRSTIEPVFTYENETFALLDRDSAGNLYSLHDNRRLLRIAPDGTRTLVADLGIWVNTLAVQGDGTAWTCSGSTIYRVAPSGVVSRFTLNNKNCNALDVNDSGDLLVGGGAYHQGSWGTSLTRVRPGVSEEILWTGGLSQATGMTRLAAGGYAITNAGDGTVVTMSETGSLTVLARELTRPADLIELPNGDLIVANTGANTLVRITRAGVVSTFASGPLLSEPYGLVMRADGVLLVTNQRANTIVQVSPAGAVSLFMRGGVHSPISMAQDVDGSLLVASATEGTITALSNGRNRTLVTGLGPLTALAADSQGTKYVMTNAGDLRRITADGVVDTRASGLGQVSAMSMQGDDVLYLAEPNQDRITALRLSTNERRYIESPFSYPQMIAPGLAGRAYFFSNRYVSLRTADGSFNRIVNGTVLRMAAQPEGGIVISRNNYDLVTVNDVGAVTSTRASPYYIYGLAARGNGKVALLKWTTRYEIDEIDLATGAQTSLMVLGTTAPQNFTSDLQGNVHYSLGAEYHRIGQDNADRSYTFNVSGESVYARGLSADGKLLLQSYQQSLYEIDIAAGTTTRVLTNLPLTGTVSRLSDGSYLSSVNSDNAAVLRRQDGTTLERIDGFTSPQSVVWTGSELRFVDNTYKLLEAGSGNSARRLAHPFYARVLTHDRARGSTFGSGYTSALLEWSATGMVSHPASFGNQVTALHAFGNGRFAVAEQAYGRVLMTRMSEIESRYGGLAAPAGIDIEPDGSILVANNTSGQVVRFSTADAAGQVVYHGGSPRFVRSGDNGSVWLSSHIGISNIDANGTVTTLPNTLGTGTTLVPYDFEISGRFATIVDNRLGVIRTEGGGSASLIAGGLSVIESVAWSAEGHPLALDRDNKLVLELRDGKLSRRMDRTSRANYLSAAADGTLYLAGQQSELVRLADGLQHRLLVGGLIGDPQFKGVAAVSDTESYVLASYWDSARGRYRSLIYKVTAERKVAPPQIGQVVHRASVPISDLASLPQLHSIDFGQWRPPYAGDFRLEVRVPGVEGVLTNFIHVGATATGTLIANPDTLPPGDQNARMQLDLTGGDFTSLSRVELARLRRVVSIGFPSGIAADRDGDLYFTTHDALYRVSPAGTQTLLKNGLSVRFGLAIDDNEALYFLQRNAGGRYDLAKFDTRTGLMTTHAALDATNASGVAVDPQGRIYVAMPNRLVRVTLDGTVTTVTTQGFPSPRGITIDGKGNVYVQNDNHLVAQVTPDGRTYPLFSRADGDDPIFEGDGYPNITADCSDNLYIATSYWPKIGQYYEEHTLAQIVSRTGHVGLLVDTSRTVPSLSDIDYLAFDRFSQRLMLWDHGTSAIYTIPVTCGSIGVEAHLYSRAGQTLAGFSRPPSATITHADGRTQYVWRFSDVSAAGLSIDFIASQSGLVLGEQRRAIDSGHLVFANSFVPGHYQIPLSIPSIRVQNAVELAVTTDRPEYQANATAGIGVGVRNPGVAAVEGVLVVDILDSVGERVDEVWRAPIALPPATTVPVSMNYGIGSLLPAGYSVRARVFDGELEIAHQRTPFTVLPANLDTAAEARLTLDRVLFDATDRVVMTSTAVNRSANINLGGLSLMLSVHAPNGEQVHSAGHVVDNLLHGATRSFVAAFPMRDAAPGEYVVRQTLEDAFGRVYDRDEMRYRVRSTAETGVGITGRISVAPASAQIGATFAIDVAAINAGNAALASGDLIVRVLEPDAALLLQEWQIPASIPVGGTQDLDRDWLSSSTPPGEYLATLSIRMAGRERLLASAAFRLMPRENPVRIGLRQALHHQGRLLVLASCVPGEAPECATRRKGEIEQLLGAIDVPHTVTTQYDTFIRLMRSDEFDAYWVSGGSLKLDQVLADEVIEATFRGDGLIVDGVHDARNQQLHAPMGVKFQGKLPLRLIEVRMEDDPVFDGDIFEVKDRTVRFALAGAVTRGRFANGDPAVLTRDFGRGRTVTMSFDFVETLKATTAADAMRETLRDALRHVLSGERGRLAAGQAFGVRSTVFNQATATPVWLRVLAPLPLSIIDTYPDATTRDANSASWRFDLDVNAEREFTTWLRAPDQDGEYVVAAEAGAGSIVGTDVKAQASTPVAVVSSERLVIDLRSDVEALRPTRAHEVQALSRVLEDIELARGKVATREYDLAIRVLLRARDSLLKVTTVDVTATRLSLSHYLAFVERKSTQQ